MKSPADCFMCNNRLGWPGPRLCSYHQGVRDGAAEERARVIKHLQRYEGNGQYLADQIERGRHVTDAKGVGE